MIPREQLFLLEAWHTNIFLELSISEIMKITKKNSKPWVFNSLKRLVKNNLLLVRRKANLDIYSLNLDNPLAIQVFHFTKLSDYLSFPRMDVIKELATIADDACLLVFGSYADDKQKDSSDLDICFLVKSEKNLLKPYVTDIKLNHPTQIHEYIFTFQEFKNMLLNNEQNLAKQIVKKHRIFVNPDIYYRLLLEARKDGWRT